MLHFKPHAMRDVERNPSATQPPTGGAIFDALAVAAEQARVRNEIAVLRDEIEQNHRCQRESLPEYSG